MHDIRLIRDDAAAFDAALARRGVEPAADRLLALDERRRALATEAQTAQARRNEASKAIGAAMAQGDAATADALKAEVATLKTRLPELEREEGKAAKALQDALAVIPNLPATDVPDGADEAGNVEQKRWGTPRDFVFIPREHADLGPALGMDFEAGAALSGARFTVLRGQMARLHRALSQFMIDMQTGHHGYTEYNTPVIVNSKAMYSTDKLPKFAEDSYALLNEYKKLQFSLQFAANVQNLHVRHDRFVDHQMSLLLEYMNRLKTRGVDTSELAGIFDNFRAYFSFNAEQFDSLVNEFEKIEERLKYLGERGQATSMWLIPTSEVTLTASFADQILADLTLPVRLTAHSLCFRSEAGSSGRDTRGLIRQHQFEKVEIVSVCRPEDSETEHLRMVAAAEAVLEALELPYRRVLLCAGDMGFGARKTYDLEVWLPGQGAYREISSISNTGDFQARRMNARFRPDGEKATRFVHTLNGSALAVGRTLVAIIENGQQADGSVDLPAALHPWLGGMTRLEPTP